MPDLHAGHNSRSGIGVGIILCKLGIWALKGIYLNGKIIEAVGIGARALSAPILALPLESCDFAERMKQNGESYSNKG